MNRPEWILVTIGFLVSCLNGAREPGYTVIQAKLTMVNDFVTISHYAETYA